MFEPLADKALQHALLKDVVGEFSEGLPSVVYAGKPLCQGPDIRKPHARNSLRPRKKTGRKAAIPRIRPLLQFLLNLFSVHTILSSLSRALLFCRQEGA